MSDMTVYNKYYDNVAGHDKYQRTIIKNVHWEDTKAANVIKSGLENADGIFISIPFLSETSRAYIKPKEFSKLSDKTGNFTLQAGDRIVKGSIDFEITGAIKNLDESFEAFTITTVDTFDFGSPHMHHWEVLAK